MKLSIFTKLLATVGLLVALLIAVGVLGISGLSGVTDKSRTTFKDVTRPLADLGSIRSVLNENRALTFMHVLETDASARKDIEKQIATNGGTANELLPAVKKTLHTDSARKTFTQIENDIAAMQKTRGEVLELSNLGRDREATVIARETLNSQAEEINEAFDTLFNSKVQLANSLNTETENAFKSSRTLSLILIVLAAIIGFAVAFVVSRGIINGVRQVLNAAERMAEGEVDQEINVKSKDEVGEMAVAFQRLIDYLKLLADSSDRVASGDLTLNVEAKSERDRLGTSFGAMVQSLRELVGKVSNTASSLSAASQEMASTSTEAGKAVSEIATAVGDVAQGAERQVRIVNTAREATEEVSAAVQQSASSAQETAEAATEAADIARGGVAAAASATEAMRAVRESSTEIAGAIEQLASKSEEIGGIVATITGIAEQTNLLALNAAIEAARAGEQGKGFAVVAEEVRKLAEDSQQAAGQISGLIGEIQLETQHAVKVAEDGAARTEEGASTVEQTREAFLRIGGSVDGMSERTGEIASAVQQIAANADRLQHEISDVASVAEQSSASAEEVSASTEQTSASTQEIAASAQELASTAEELERLVSQFQLA